MSDMRRAAVERVASIGKGDDLDLAMKLTGDAGREAAAIVLGDVEGQAERWREQLVAQGYKPEQG